MINQIRPSFANGGFGGEVSWIDLTHPLNRKRVTAIECGIDRYVAIVYHGQQITDGQQKAFSLNFGVLEGTAVGTVPGALDQPRPGAFMADVPNLRPDNKPLARGDKRHMFNLGNRLWHTGSSFRAVLTKYTLISRLIGPDPTRRFE